VGDGAAVGCGSGVEVGDGWIGMPACVAAEAAVADGAFDAATVLAGSGVTDARDAGSLPLEPPQAIARAQNTTPTIPRSRLMIIDGEELPPPLLCLLFRY
jgi:hypothetical protein